MRYALPDGQTVRIDQEFEMGGVRYPSTWLRLMTPTERTEFGAVDLLEPPAQVRPYPPPPRAVRRGVEERVHNRRPKHRPRAVRAVPDYVREPRGPTATHHGPTDPARGRPVKQHRPAHEGRTGHHNESCHAPLT